jgi:hypothetical protein
MNNKIKNVLTNYNNIDKRLVEMKICSHFKSQICAKNNDKNYLKEEKVFSIFYPIIV